MHVKARSRSKATVLRVGIDTGGTFTDLVLFDGRSLHLHKLPSTPKRPEESVLIGLRELLDGRATDLRALTLHYGTTVATNAVLERKGARVVVVTTAGFEDLIEIGRQVRPDLYALSPQRPRPLVPRRARVGVHERMLYDGSVLESLTPSEIQRTVVRVRKLAPESLAVCLLHSYANATHEVLLAKALEKLHVSVSVSSSIAGEYREYERLSTTVLNSYVAPIVSRHLHRLKTGLGKSQLRVMQSNGSVISAKTASSESVRTLLSGPAAGVVGAHAIAKQIGIDRLVTIDMGGTSTDVCLIDGEPRLRSEWEIGGLAVKVPALDIHTVGAGGGSLARIDAGGVLKVGPESAGADPGPACYGRGTGVTVTDANAVLQRLVPDSFLGGRMMLDMVRARKVVARLGNKLRLTPEETADGIVRVVNAAMERAIRRVSIERGHDPRQFTLIAFGGAAGLHACQLADGLEMTMVVIPLHPGLLSACGALSAPTQRDYVRTIRAINPTLSAMTKLVRPLLRRARHEIKLEQMAGGLRPELKCLLDMRYAGQSYELPLQFAAGFLDAFHRAHHNLYGYADPERAVEVVNIRVCARIPGVPVRAVNSPGVATARPKAHRVRFENRWIRCRLLARESLAPGDRAKGPLLITELSATTFVPRNWNLQVSDAGHLVLRR